MGSWLILGGLCFRRRPTGPGCDRAGWQGSDPRTSRRSFYIAGFIAGDLIWFAVAAMSVSALVTAFASLKFLLRFGGALYLRYLSFHLLTRPASFQTAGAMVRPHGAQLRSFSAALTLTLSNPKTILFFVALLPSVLDLGSIRLMDGLTVAAGMTIVLVQVLSSYMLLANSAKALLRSDRARRPYMGDRPDLHRLSAAHCPALTKMAEEYLIRRYCRSPE